MKTYRILVDNEGKMWKDRDPIKLTFTGAREGIVMEGRIKTIGVQMMTVEVYKEGSFKEEQLMDLATIKTIESIYPYWLKE